MTGWVDRWNGSILGAKSGIQKSTIPSIQFCPRKAGLTMIELLVVLIIVTILIGVSVPTISTFTSPKHALRKDARKLMVALNEARWTAMNRKVRIQVLINPALQEVRAVETAPYRALTRDNPYDLAEIDEAERSAAMSNHFERVVAYDEEMVLEAFTAADIEVETDEDDLFRRVELEQIDYRDYAEQNTEEVAVSFNYFGGSDGGGISLSRGTVRLDIACDILTGRPKIVKRAE